MIATPPHADVPQGRFVLGLAGSPRRHGNSERLLDVCLEGASAAGAEVFKLRVADYGIAPCKGCNSCSRTGDCAIKDRMAEVYELLDAASAVVVATPVFFATVPAVLKALYDRCQRYWARRFVLSHPAPETRPGGLLVCGGGGDPYGPGCAVTTSRSVFGVLRIAMEEPIVVEGADKSGEIAGFPEAIASARALGELLGRQAATP